MNFQQRPFTVIWEVTRACDLACVHCRAEANPQRSADELTFEEAQALVQNVKAFGTPYPLFILTGGDPAKRPDIFDIIAYARAEGLRVAMTPSATPLITRAAIQRFAQAGLVRLAVSLDGKGAPSHDGFRGVPGSFTRTLRILDWCAEFGLEAQIHTTVTRHVLDDLPAIAEQRPEPAKRHHHARGEDREHDDADERELPVEVEQDAERDHRRHESAHQLHQARPHQVAYPVGVVHDS